MSDVVVNNQVRGSAQDSGLPPPPTSSHGSSSFSLKDDLPADHLYIPCLVIFSYFYPIQIIQEIYISQR